MILLNSKAIEQLKVDLFYRINKYNEFGDVYSYHHKKDNGDFLDIIIELNSNKFLVLMFNLDGYLISVELKEKERRNSILILKRNYNSLFYVFPRNCLNLERDTIDYYLDYYNNYIIINDKFSKQLLTEIYFIVSYMRNQKEFSKYSQLLELILSHDINELFDPEHYKKQGYLTRISVLPPNVRPDNNHNYAIIQIVCGCKIMLNRNKACAFCSSFSKYSEKTDDDIREHIKLLKNDNPNMIKNANCVFLADGDPLSSKNIIRNMVLIKKLLPNIKYFESFISTSTILSIDSQQWVQFKKMGLRKVYWGVESADDRTLLIIDKPHDARMLSEARSILESNLITYDIILMSGIGELNKQKRTDEDITMNSHVILSSEFVNKSKCASVFISKLQITASSSLNKRINVDIFPYGEHEMEAQYRSMVKCILKNVRGSYGNQFVVEKGDMDEF